MDMILDLKNYDNNAYIFKRVASRAIIANGDKYLLIYSKYGDYKFPGGGVEEGESLEDTLIREAIEETGYRIDRDSIRKYGKVLERRKGGHESILEMESHYFFCKVEADIEKRKLDDYEKEYDYKVTWITLKEAIEKNKQVAALDTCPWVIRETKVMERLVKEQFFYDNILPYLPDDMKALLKGHSFDIDTIGCSGSSLFSFDNDLVLKVEQKTIESDSEYRMMNWLQGKLPVPEIVSFHTDGKSNYLLMTKLQGKMACDTDILADGEKMARLLAKGLKRLWQVDIEGCPRSVNLDYLLDEALSMIESGMTEVDYTQLEAFGIEGFTKPMEIYEYLKNNRPKEETAFVHGDYCLPNIFINNNNEISGYLDLGFCGVGDKWMDIALGVRSMRFNLELIRKGDLFLPLYNIFFEELGMDPDEEKIRYYIILDELF